ncbi:DNA-binding protein [Betaproteobacteria bacterium]|nr:DNA-binding protein [Betaproteobacteria bacterium]GHU00943.1 DNA-binding protein [Betaproteobacteria bacterium]GHU13333.1 DNA-binding protein [Betaproteobacteria bacterium]GHU13344.1 DNA-binding protein [Betaproteobacteria bacterium]GHU19878.1 DNA-binding protein [Betaproteobacteria bacterium]
MKVVVDTNILARLFLEPENAADGEQRAIVEKLFLQFSSIVIPTHVFCELAWILNTRNKFTKDEVYGVFRHLLKTTKIVCKEDEVNAGMLMLERGGDFADGVNEYTGRMMTNGESVFATFDKEAAKLLNERGIAAMIPQL